MRIDTTVREVIRDALVLVFSCGFVPVWIALEIFGLVAGGPVT